MRYIGVDLHKTNFVVCFLSEDDKSQTETFTLDTKGLARFKRRLRPDDKLAVEASANTFYFCRQVKGLGLDGVEHRGVAAEPGAGRHIGRVDGAPPVLVREA